MISTDPRSSPACPHSLFALERKRASGILSRSDWGRPFCPWDADEARITLPPVRQPARCREHGTYGGQGKAVGCVPPTALWSEESRSSFSGMVTPAGLEPATCPAPVNQGALSPWSHRVVT